MFFETGLNSCFPEKGNYKRIFFSSQFIWIKRKIPFIISNFSILFVFYHVIWAFKCFPYLNKVRCLAIKQFFFLFPVKFSYLNVGSWCSILIQFLYNLELCVFVNNWVFLKSLWSMRLEPNILTLWYLKCFFYEIFNYKCLSLDIIYVLALFTLSKDKLKLLNVVYILLWNSYTWTWNEYIFHKNIFLGVFKTKQNDFLAQNFVQCLAITEKTKEDKKAYL